jgi:CheY-like chemotaxis protein
MNLEALKKKILIADDDPELREVIKDSIELLAPQTRFIEAQDGQIALSKLRNEKFDLLIMDLAMPRLDGKGLLQSLAKLPKDHRPGYVLVLSGSLSGGQKRLGRVTYQGKPFQLEEIKTFLIECFSPKKADALPGIGEEDAPQSPSAPVKDPGVELTKLFAEALQNALKKNASQDCTAQPAVKSDEKSVSCQAGASVVSSCLVGGLKVQLVHSFSEPASVQLAEALTGGDDSAGEIEGARAALVHLIESAAAEARSALERIGQSVSGFTYSWSSSDAPYRVGFGHSKAIYRTEVQGSENLSIIVSLSFG